MLRHLHRSCAALLLVSLAACTRAPVHSSALAQGEQPEFELLGSASVPGDAHDRSGLAGALADGTPLDRLGGFGSAVAWTGRGLRFLAACDRGPGDGATAFPIRVQVLDLKLGDRALAVELVATTLLVDEQGRAFVGDARAFDTEHPERGLRLDPEGLRVGRDGHFFVSDEYGPWLLEFDAAGRCLRRLAVPEKFRVPHPASGDEERLAGNTRGRLSNRGFEGLAIASDGARLYALLQSPLIQDHGREGTLCRLLEVDLESGRTREFAAPLEDPALVFNELLALDARRFLAIERDGKAGLKARVKRVIELDIGDASDVGALAELPARATGAAFAAARRRPFLDLLDPALGLAGADFPEKIEGLAFGPDLADGRHLLIVSSDNDLVSAQPSRIWAVGIARERLAGFVQQSFEAVR